MKTIGAGEFRAKCLKLMDEVAQSGEVLVVTKRGNLWVELRPAKVEAGDVYEKQRASLVWESSDFDTWSAEDQWEALATDSSRPGR